MLPVILKLLSLAPSALTLYKSLKEDDKPALLEQVVAVATDAVKQANPTVKASTLSPEEILQYSAAAPVKEAVATAIDKLAAEELALRLADVKHAREHTAMVDRPMMIQMATSIMRYNALFCILLLAILIASIQLFKGNEVMIAIVSTSIGGLASQLLSERLQLLNYYFGASVSNDNKIKPKDH